MISIKIEKALRFIGLYRQAGLFLRDFRFLLMAWKLLGTKEMNYRHLLGSDEKPRLSTRAPQGDCLEQAERLNRLVLYGTIFYDKPRSCIQKTRALSLILRRAGISHQIKIGWNIENAHAWIEVNQVPIAQDGIQLDQFRSLDPI